jgi:hypothetical protein
VEVDGCVALQWRMQPWLGWVWWWVVLTGGGEQYSERVPGLLREHAGTGPGTGTGERTNAYY